MTATTERCHALAGESPPYDCLAGELFIPPEQCTADELAFNCLVTMRMAQAAIRASREMEIESFGSSQIPQQPAFMVRLAERACYQEGPNEAEVLARR